MKKEPTIQEYAEQVSDMIFGNSMVQSYLKTNLTQSDLTQSEKAEQFILRTRTGSFWKQFKTLTNKSQSYPDSPPCVRLSQNGHLWRPK